MEAGRLTRLTGIAAAIAALAVSVAVFGCGQSAPAGNGPAAAIASLTKKEARAAVERFYASIDNGRFGAAWDQLSPSTRSSLGTLDAWESGHEGREYTGIADMWVEPRSRSRSLVHIDLTTRDTNECDISSEQRFSGTWLIHEKRGKAILSNPQISFVRGDDPEEADALCQTRLAAARQLRKEKRQAARERRIARALAKVESHSYDYTGYDDEGYGDPDYESSDYGSGGDDYGSNYGGSYSSGGSYGSSYGMDLGPGRGSTVTCADGSISHSGGIQGACSWHGGVAGG